MKWIVIGVVVSVILFCNGTFSQIYDGDPYAPSRAYIGASCSQSKIDELIAWGNQQSCPSNPYYGKHPIMRVSDGGCTVTTCIRCGASDFYIGEKKCLKPQYYAAVPIENVPPQLCVANPVEPSSGTKIQKEVDIASSGLGQIGFDRIYNNGNKSASTFWYNPYQKSLNVIDPEKITIAGEKSSLYASKDAACTSGWNEIKTKISDLWALNATARYSNNTCQIVRNNVVVRNIPILLSGQSTITFIKPGAVKLLREDGSILSFGLSANEKYRELNGERGQLISVTNAAPVAWRYSAPNGDIEDYDVNGKLLSITASNGMKQELFYDAVSGLLSRITDSAGRELVFAYIGNQINSVTVDGNKTTFYTYNSLGLITSVTHSDNTVRIYHYEDSRFPKYITGITDERGKRYAT